MNQAAVEKALDNISAVCDHVGLQDARVLQTSGRISRAGIEALTRKPPKG